MIFTGELKNSMYLFSICYPFVKKISFNTLFLNIIGSNGVLYRFMLKKDGNLSDQAQVIQIDPKIPHYNAIKRIVNF